VLAESIGEKLGADAHLAALRRTRAGAFRVEDAVSLDRLQAMADEGRQTKLLLPLDAALSEMPFVHLSEQDAKRTRHGAVIYLDGAAVKWGDACHVQMRNEHGRLIAIGVYSSTNGQLHPRILLDPEEE
jgi:tRNA pseudouridine55 synthase